MNIKNISSNRGFFNKIKEIDFEEAKKYDDLFNINIKSKFKLILKRFIINFLNFFFNLNLNYNNSRKIENVKNKYDDIAGSYIYKYEKDSKYLAYNHFEDKIYHINSRAIDHPANLISKFCDHFDLKSVIEVGAGELTTLLPVVQKTKKINFVSGLDLSFNRLKKGKEFFDKYGVNINHLVACDASKLPYRDSSFDLVFSHYCIEQVPALAEKIINEMIRVASKYIIFIEPTYEFSNASTRNKILVKGYPILKRRHFTNNKSKIIYRDGLPFARYSTYAELTILEKINKSDGNPVMCHPLNNKVIELNNNFALCDGKKIKFESGITDLTNL